MNWKYIHHFVSETWKAELHFVVPLVSSVCDELFCICFSYWIQICKNANQI